MKSSEKTGRHSHGKGKREMVQKPRNLGASRSEGSFITPPSLIHSASKPLANVINSTLKIHLKSTDLFPFPLLRLMWSKTLFHLQYKTSSLVFLFLLLLYFKYTLHTKTDLLKM